MKPASLTPRSVDIGGATLCAAILGAFYFLAGAPLLKEQASTRSAAEAIRADHARIGRLNLDLSQTRRAIAGANERLAGLGGAARRAESVNLRASSIVALAKELKLELAEATPGQVRAGAEFNAVPLAIGGKGSLASVSEFLKKLHADMADVAVDSVEIRSGDAGTRAENLAVEFSLKLTYYIEHAGDNASAAALTPSSPETP